MANRRMRLTRETANRISVALPLVRCPALLRRLDATQGFPVSSLAQLLLQKAKKNQRCVCIFSFNGCGATRDTLTKCNDGFSLFSSFVDRCFCYRKSPFRWGVSSVARLCANWDCWLKKERLPGRTELSREKPGRFCACQTTIFSFDAFEAPRIIWIRVF